MFISRAVAVFISLIAVLLTPRAAFAGANLCCPADISGNGLVDAEDVAILLGEWNQPGAADIDGSGTVEAADLSIVLGAWGECPQPCTLTNVIGSVQFVDGTPVPGALVLTNVGGKAMSDATGQFSFQVDVGDASTLIVSATVAAAGGTAFGSSEIESVIVNGTTDAGLIHVSIASGCPTDYDWLPNFMPLGANGTLYALTVFDDGKGAGPALYIGGNLSAVCDLATNGIARWDGENWSAVGSGSGVNSGSYVFALEVFDEGKGDGPALFAGGTFTSIDGQPASGLARWDGDTWSTVGATVEGTSGMIKDMVVFDDGSGPSLFVAGAFLSAGGVTVNGIAKWDGESWSALTGPNGTGVAGTIQFLLPFDDGTGRGEELYVCGSITSAGGVPSWRVARWNGSEWSTLGSRGILYGSAVWAMAAFDAGFGAGPELHIGGNFQLAGNPATYGLAKWNGTQWVAVGAGNPIGSGGTVYYLTVHDDGSGAGPSLYLGGDLHVGETLESAEVLRWDGLAFSALSVGELGPFGESIYSLLSTTEIGGSEPRLIVAGGIPGTVEVPYRGIRQWDGSTWSGLLSSEGAGVGGTVYATAIYDDGSGPALFVGGLFRLPGSVGANNIAKWDGQQWSSLGAGASNGTNWKVDALAVYDDESGSGPKLYVGGDFTTAGGIPTNYLASWDGKSWAKVGTGLNGGNSGFVAALAVHQEPTHPKPSLYVGGDFTNAGGVFAKHVARWNGSNWSKVGAGFSSEETTVPGVYALTVFDDGSGGGPALFAGGGFTSSGGVEVKRVARWNGTSWVPLDSGIEGDNYPKVYALRGYDDGSDAGPALFAGGTFTIADGNAANNIAAWRPREGWSPILANGANGVPGVVRAMTVLDTATGSGPMLCVGGEFGQAGSALGSVARWNGTTWIAVGADGGVNNHTYAISVGEIATDVQPSLFLGGSFTRASDQPSISVAQWRCSPR